MAVAYDAVSNNGSIETTNADISWTHTPVGTPKGVVVFVYQEGAVSDEVVGVTYGGVAMTRLQLATNGGEPVACYAYFLGSGIPTGAQTVLVDNNGTSDKRACCVTVTAATNTGALSAKQEGDVANPAPAVSNPSLWDTLVLGGLMTGNTQANLAAGSGMTELFESNVGASNACSAIRKNSNSSASSITAEWTVASDDMAAVAVGIYESEYTISGTVTLSGSPVSAAKVAVITADDTSMTNASLLTVATTDGSGNWSALVTSRTKLAFVFSCKDDSGTLYTGRAHAFIEG